MKKIISSDIQKPSFVFQKSSKDNLIEEFKRASKCGDIEVIKALMGSEMIPYYVKGHALEDAAKYGYLKLVLELNTCLEIPLYNKEAAVLIAAENGKLSIINAFISGQEISSNTWGKALVRAEKYGHVEVLQKIKTLDISKEFEWQAMYASLKNKENSSTKI